MAKKETTVYVIENATTGEWYGVAQTQLAAEAFVEIHGLRPEQVKVKSTGLVTESMYKSFGLGA